MSPNPPQAFISTYGPRLRTYGNALLTPVAPQTIPSAPSARTTKRGTVAKNYAEDEHDDDDIFEDGDGHRRSTGHRLRRGEDQSQAKQAQLEMLGREIESPVDVQGIWREWMGKLRIVRNDRQRHAQVGLPLTLVPIRIDVDISPFVPPPPLPLPPTAQELGINSASPAYRTPDATSPYRLKDTFLWNLHEVLVTPDQFATIMINDLDLPSNTRLGLEISNQIRSQLEEYAGLALHPLFHPASIPQEATAGQTPQGSNAGSNDQGLVLEEGRTSRHERNGKQRYSASAVSATASAIPLARKHERDKTAKSWKSNNEIDPDDMYRCIISLNVHLQNKLYTDKFEWSLLHPVGLAERFARLTCADLGLAGEWAPTIAHAIYEAVLRLKKEACESGGLFAATANGYGLDLDNLAASDAGAGWRFDYGSLMEEWEPHVEQLSKEDLEKREGDRERQLRRLRRETARFSSTANVGTYNISIDSRGRQLEDEETPMGRGERSKRKKRFKSLSPVGGKTTEVGNSGYGGGGVGALNEWERQTWRCSHCLIYGSAVWGVRDGPKGPRTLCSNCGLIYERDKRLPVTAKNLHINDIPLAR